MQGDKERMVICTWRQRLKLRSWMWRNAKTCTRGQEESGRFILPPLKLSERENLADTQILLVQLPELWRVPFCHFDTEFVILCYHSPNKHTHAPIVDSGEKHFNMYQAKKKKKEKFLWPKSLNKKKVQDLISVTYLRAFDIKLSVDSNLSLDKCSTAEGILESKQCGISGKLSEAK